MPPPRRTATNMQTMPLGRHLQTQRTELGQVCLRNFKGHADLKLDMSKITVLIGPTNSGKSTVFQALSLLRSALESDGFRVLEGNHDYGSFADIATDRDEGKEIGIEVRGRRKVRTGAGAVISTKFSYGVAFGGDLHPTRVDADVDIKCDSPPDEDATLSLEHSYTRSATRTTVSGTGTPDGSPVQAQHGDGDRLAPSIAPKLAERPITRAFRSMFQNGDYFRSLLDGLWHIPFSRVVTSYALPIEYGTSYLSPDRTRGAASLLSYIGSKPSVQEKVSGMIQEMGLKRIVAQNISVQIKKEKELVPYFVRSQIKKLLRYDETSAARIHLNFPLSERRAVYPVKIEHRKNFLAQLSEGPSNPIMHEGSGLNQLVTMLTILADTPRGSVITIEEPEIHLDPAAQARLMKIMVRQALEEDKQVIFTTHSDHLLYPLLAYVEKEDFPLANNDVAMHYFSTDESGAVGAVERLAINKRGQIRGGLKGFWGTDAAAMDEILR